MISVVRFNPIILNPFRKATKDAFCTIVLYGASIKFEKTGGEWFNFLVDYLNNNNYTPTIGSVYNYYEHQVRYPDKELSYKSLVNTLKKNDYKDVDELILSDVEGKDDIENFFLKITVDKKYGINSIILIQPTQNIKFNKGLYADIDKLISYFVYEYGFLIKSETRNSGFFYALGAIEHNFLKFWKTRSDSLLEKWKYNVESVLKGRIRDVFEYNFINFQQLDYKLNDNQTLKEYILSDFKRGTLEALTGDVYIWKVDKSNLEEVRKELYKASDIVICNPYTF